MWATVPWSSGEIVGMLLFLIDIKAKKHFAHRACPRLDRGGRSYNGSTRLAGRVSGATAPPEMMKAIAWSMLQSVGVSSATGTTTR